MLPLLALLLFPPDVFAPPASKTVLEVYVATSASAPGAKSMTLSLPGRGSEQIFFEGKSALAVHGVASADAGVAPEGGGEIHVVLTADAARTLAEVTWRNMGRRLGIVVDGRLRAAPVVVSGIANGVLVLGGFTPAEAIALAPKIGPPSPPPTIAPAPTPESGGPRLAARLPDGTWILRGATLDGQPVPDPKFSSGTWTFSSGALSATNGEGKSVRFTLATDPGAPDAFRLDPVAPSTERPILMLFRIEGDRLTVAFFDGMSGLPLNFEPERKKVVLEFRKSRR